MTMLMERRDIEAPTATIVVLPDHTGLSQVRRRVARGALPRDRRIQISFDSSTGDYRLGVAVPHG